MITNAIARRYAKALIELAEEDQAVEKYYGELKTFEAIMEAAPEGAGIFASPAFTSKLKEELLKGLISGRDLSDTVNKFLFLLLQKNRLDELPRIISNYRELADELSGVVRGTVTSALPLEKERIDKLRAALEHGTGKKVLLQVEVDPTLIGGVVTRIGDRLFDGSIKTQLDRIQDILQKG